MQEQFFFNLVFLLALVVSTVIRVPFEQRYKRNTIIKSLRTHGEIAYVYLLFLAMAVLPLLFIFSTYLTVSDYSRPGSLGWIGTASLVAAIWLFWRSHVDLGQNWSVSLELHAQHQLVEHGVYANIRHPMYSATFLWCISICLLIPNWLAGPAGLLCFSGLYLSRVRREEALMHAHFGPSYAQYCTRSGRLWPRYSPVSMVLFRSPLESSKRDSDDE